MRTDRNIQSPSGFWLNLAGGGVFVGSGSWLHQLLPALSFPHLSVIAFVLTGVFLVGAEMGLHGLQREGPLMPWPVRLRRMSVALLLFLGSAAAYVSLPLYQTPFYASFRAVLPLLWGAGGVLTLLYLAFVDVYGTPQSLTFSQVLRGFALRAFFIPFMLTGLVFYAGQLMGGLQVTNWPSALVALYMLAACFDLLIGCLGYITTLRPLGTQTRSTDSSWLGWFVCLICYAPFIDFLYLAYLIRPFTENPEWHVWMQGWPQPLFWLWGALVVTTQLTENLTTLCYGLRFSNLSYRGLISYGPYRFTKHPQYVAKLLNRFLVSVPFLSLNGPLGIIENCAAFVLLVAIYVLRAQTEERHLARYPEYAAYALEMNQRSLFRYITALKFKTPQTTLQ